MINKLKAEFMALQKVDASLAVILPKTNPYNNLLGQKLLDVMLLLRFVIDVEEAEVKNPVGVKVTEKPKLQEVPSGSN